jgi:hypothetical protein
VVKHHQKQVGPPYTPTFDRKSSNQEIWGLLKKSGILRSHFGIFFWRSGIMSSIKVGNPERSLKISNEDITAMNFGKTD